MVLKSLVMLFNFEGTVKAALSATCGDNSEEVPPVPIPNTVVKQAKLVSPRKFKAQ